MKKQLGRQALSTKGTALTKYQRLESMAYWRETAQAQPREVVVKMREATLILADPRSEEVLSHWSLPAIMPLSGAHERPARYAPGDGIDETLEISDDDMIEALTLVLQVVRSTAPHPKRLRGWLIGSSVAAILAVAGLVLPNLMKSHTAQMVPAPKRAEIGMRALDDVIKLTGAPCSGELGLPALARLSERVFGPENTPLLYVLPEELKRPANLPGGVILLPKSLIEEDGPDALAGAALAEAALAHHNDPLRPILDHAGIKASFDLLTSGDLPQHALKNYAEVLLRQSPSPVPDAQLVAEFTKAEVPMRAWAQWARNADSERLAALDPFIGRLPNPILPDDDWIALQSVCSG